MRSSRKTDILDKNIVPGSVVTFNNSFLIMINININNIDFTKLDGLIPAVIQDAQTYQVLMLGFMNSEAVQETMNTGKVTFYSRTKQRLWMKGAEESGNFLWVVDIKLDCDQDSLLILANPDGPTCHKGNVSCFSGENVNVKKCKCENNSLVFLLKLEQLISDRKKDRPEGSYVTSLFESGVERIAQKVGEEATETVIAALSQSKEKFISESADLLFHWLVLATEKEVKLSDVTGELEKRGSLSSVS